MSEYQWKTVSVVGFDELMQALDRADRKGYMPDAIKEEWEAFNWEPEQPAQQEPVAWGVDWGKAGDIPCVSIIKRLPDGRIEVVAVEYAPYSYTSPPAQRKPLTDEEIESLWDNGMYVHCSGITALRAIARAIEAAHGITGEKK